MLHHEKTILWVHADVTVGRATEICTAISRMCQGPYSALDRWNSRYTSRILASSSPTRLQPDKPAFAVSVRSRLLHASEQTWSPAAKDHETGRCCAPARCGARGCSRHSYVHRHVFRGAREAVQRWRRHLGMQVMPSLRYDVHTTISCNMHRLPSCKELCCHWCAPCSFLGLRTSMLLL